MILQLAYIHDKFIKQNIKIEFLYQNLYCSDVRDLYDQMINEYRIIKKMRQNKCVSLEYMIFENDIISIIFFIIICLNV